MNTYNKDAPASLDELIKFLRTCPGVKVEVAAGDFQPYIHFHFLLRSLDALEAMRAQRDDVVHDSFYETGYGLTSGAAKKIGALDAEIARILRGEKP